MCRCVISRALLCVVAMSMLAEALALPPTQLWLTVVFTPNLMSEVLSCLTASESSSCSVVDFSVRMAVSKLLSKVRSTRVLRVLISTSSTVAPGLSHT